MVEMFFPVVQYTTKYGVDFRVGASEANTRSGSRLIGYMQAPNKRSAIEKLKEDLEKAADKLARYG